ncbi:MULTISPECIES: ATP-dependent zinc metalloprotease FtsH [Aerococcus]|uniref:ATP-dependent zinc metalloprotease FtsH n=1 Tax=Aerococcus sanguinicola TaxID=119206 RepID=A0A120I955_9LACT|nr:MULTISPECIES: ATP-dependent zinc metalloprotease FtsH [Aerococcus]AMB93849.1 cell division protein FtsH [Aerococcus sanguinicola]MDK7050295.1 ATP-dependent zinc metalloprotease FtsH [Aerococcus sanguinicola]OFT94941.1 cell division protein FtsH [Aerococcus sp. HMSC23C02]PKZ21417.1 ATP-dependent metallopeptidase FtsH/Yme1/Tma family protein [Aerococcus sanguinicola]
MQRKGPNKSFLTSGLLWIIIFFALIGLVNYIAGGGDDGSTEEITQTEFMQELSDENLQNIAIQPQAGAYQITGDYRASRDKQESQSENNLPIFNNAKTGQAKKFFTRVLPNNDTLAKISQTAEETDTSLKALKEDSSGVWVNLLFSALPLVIFIGFMYFMTQRAQGGGRGNPMSMGKSNAKDQSQQSKVRFADVAGADEEKQELVEVVEFLKDPRKYHQLGARIPKGVLLEGPPGTGKTLLAKAVAGEAQVPFYSISGSEFVEMFVGVGASRVRDLFDTAKKNSPAIIFIDEIDAVGRKRGSGMGGGHDEREQTLNQLLVELDGFTEQDNVIVIAATNRSDVLDPALLRPGRFDRQILVGRPDVKGREAILKVHARNKKLGPDVDLKVLARQTPGFTGAELENVLNEAALLAARLDKAAIDMVDVDEAQDRVIAGPAKPDRQVSEKERRVTAFHEAGHTVCGLVLNEARIVHKVTIVPRGKAGGYAIMLPREDQNMYNAKDLREQIVGLLGGRAAEEVFFNTQTSGASNDFEQATSLGRSMITEYGMSKTLGPISYEGNHSMRGAQSYGEKTYSAQTAAKIDQELLQLMEDCLAEAKQILSDHREQVTIIAEKLLELETLDARTIKSLFETGEMPAETVTEVEEEARPKTYDEVKEKMQREGQKKQEESKEQLEERQGLDASESDSEDQEPGRRNEHIQEEIAQRRQDEKDED